MPPFDFAVQTNSTDGSLDLTPCGACPVRNMSVCAALHEDELGRLADIVTTIRMDAHDTLFSEGDPATNMYNVTSGTVKLYKLLPDGRRQITGFLGAGDFVGLSIHETYAYSVEAVGPTTLCRFPRKQLDRLLEEYPKLQRRLFGLASNELAAAQDQMLLLGRKTAKEKIASFLLALSEKAARRGQPDNPVRVTMSRSDIADYLGLTTETVSRTFTNLKASGIIRLMDGGKVSIADRDRMLDIAEGL